MYKNHSESCKIIMVFITLSLLIPCTSCTVNYVDKVYRGSIELKTFDFEKFTKEEVADQPFLGNNWGCSARKATSGKIVWYDHYFKKKHIAQYNGVTCYSLGMAGEKYQRPGTYTYFPLLYSNSKKKCHYYIQLFACNNHELSSNKTYPEQRMIIRNSESDRIYDIYIVLSMKDIDNRKYFNISVATPNTGIAYDYIIGFSLKRDFVVYNKSMDKKLITFYKGSYVNFSKNQPFYFR
jgi:hypothetical protein